jgi:hypothetical protein
MCPENGLFWRKFHGLLRRLYMCCCRMENWRCLSGPLDLWYHSILEFLWCCCWFCFFFSVWPIYQWERTSEVSHYHCFGNCLCF